MPIDRLFKRSQATVSDHPATNRFCALSSHMINSNFRILCCRNPSNRLVVHETSAALRRLLSAPVSTTIRRAPNIARASWLLNAERAETLVQINLETETGTDLRYNTRSIA